MTHEKQIEIRWRDVDKLGHVNNAVYATFLEECRDEWAELAFGPEADPWEYVMARVAIDFRAELLQEDDVAVVRTRLTRIGTSSLTLSEEIRKPDGTIAAEAESVIVARDRATGRSRPLRDDERVALERMLAER